MNWYLITITCVAVFRLIIARYFPLIGDEGYYWLWSQHLALGCIDHPPMIAYLNWIIATATNNSAYAIRIAATIVSLTSSFFVYLSAQELYDKKTGRLAAILFIFTPIFFSGGIFLVPQQLLIFFWTLGLFVFIKLIKSGQASLWYLLAAIVGVGLVSEYIMVAFFACTALYLLLYKPARAWYLKKEPYLAATLAFLIFSPVVLWNLQHLGYNSAFWGKRFYFAFNQLFDNFAYFFGLQAVLYTPILLGFVIALAINLKKFYQDQDENNLLLICFSLPVFFCLFALAFMGKVGGHWPAAAYIPIIIILAKQNKKTLIIWTLGFALLINTLAISYSIFFYPTPTELKGQEISINYQLAQYLNSVTPKSGRTYVLTTNLGLGGLISFYGQTRVYMAAGRHPQYDIWGSPNLKQGDNVIYFALNENDLISKIKPFFRVVTHDKRKVIFSRDSDIPNSTTVFIGRHFLGGQIP